MSQSDMYYKDGATRILELLKATCKSEFKAYYNGQVDEPAESMMPCLMVSETTGSVEGGATGTDDVYETILITVVYNKKDDLGGNPESELTEFKVRKIVKAQDPLTMRYLPNTIMYALRKNVTMGDAILDSSIETDFNVNERGNVLTQEGYVLVTVKRLALVPDRQ